MKPNSKNYLEVLEWGRLDYSSAYNRQLRLVQERISGQAPDRMIFVEHHPVVTVGRSGTASDILASDEVFRQRGVKKIDVDRGGRATYHGPQQMVAYPIIRIHNQDMHMFVYNILESVASVLRDFGLNPSFKDGQPGLWVNGKKIASIGIAVKKRITYHGVALNVNTDLSNFSLIAPCGHSDEIMTSMEAESGRAVDMASVKKKFIRAFCDYFGYETSESAKRPPWLILPSPSTSSVDGMESLLGGLKLKTVCQSGHCPNLGECFNRGTATFMILGNRCTRNCGFCAVDKGRPGPPDTEEPKRVAHAVKKLGLSYVVITSVTRDDLPCQGADQFVNTISEIRKTNPNAKIEILVPDFMGSKEAFQKVCDACPDMFNHNIETVPRLYSLARPKARFERSLALLEYAAERGLKVKSGMMLGLGERDDEIDATLSALFQTGCRYLTLGQYLAPSKEHIPIDRYVHPDEFDMWAEKAKRMGFEWVAAGPLVRSSYRADEMAMCRIHEHV